MRTAVLCFGPDRTVDLGRRTGMTATQLSMFERDEAARPRRPRPRFAHVLRDPGVASSVARRSELGCDLRSAFVSFWTGLSAEQRAELRARLATAALAAK